LLLLRGELPVLTRFAETLRVLKWKKLPRNEYLGLCRLLISYIEGGRLHLDDSSMDSFEIFAQAEAIALRYKKIDLSDALQIVSIKHGKLKHGVNG
jgi:hypothetical protein